MGDTGELGGQALFSAGKNAGFTVGGLLNFEHSLSLLTDLRMFLGWAPMPLDSLRNQKYATVLQIWFEYYKNGQN